MVVSWCMRMEAKNSYFKKVARIGNFNPTPLQNDIRDYCAPICKGSFLPMMSLSVDHVSNFGHPYFKILCKAKKE